MRAFLRASRRFRPVAAAAGAGCGAALYSARCAQPAQADSTGLWSWNTGCSDTPSLEVSLKHVPECDPDFVPAVMWNRAYRKLAAETPGSAPLAIGLSRPDGTASVFRTVCLPPTAAFEALNEMYVERIVKFLLWGRGGDKIYLCGDAAATMASMLEAKYAKGGAREFDANFIYKLFETNIQFVVCEEADLPSESTSSLPLGRNLEGCRIGFDLGGSDRKCAALINGKVVFSEEVRWDPYFCDDPQYHYDGIMHSLKLAAAHLPRVDAIGGSSAGVYINNKVRVASLFRGVAEKSPELFDSKVKNMFLDVANEWGVPFEVLNDGDVTALAASMSLEKNAIIGMAMGTSVAGGFCDPQGNLTNWLNELAFVPVDFRPSGPVDEWSGDEGCGVQYFSQQGACRLLPAVGINLPADMKFPEQLVELQKLMAAGDARATKVYEALGIEFGYTLAHFAEFYDYTSLLIMGRVTSGPGGQIMINKATAVLKDEFPELSIEVIQPSEKDKRHGQAIAAGSLPALASR